MDENWSLEPILFNVKCISIVIYLMFVLYTVYCVGLEVLLFFNRLFFVLEQGPSARSFVLIPVVLSLFRSVPFFCVLDRERFQGIDWTRLRGRNRVGERLGKWEVTRPLANHTKLTEFTILKMN